MSDDTPNDDTPNDDTPSDDAPSKDAFFEQLGRISDAMIAAHGKDFAMGALVLAARYIAEGESRARAAAAAEAGIGAMSPPKADPKAMQ
jgi:hypothetical protein